MNPRLEFLNRRPTIVVYGYNGITSRMPGFGLVFVSTGMLTVNLSESFPEIDSDHLINILSD